MAQDASPIKVALKYCGCCNPYVDLTKIARHLADMARTRGDFVLVPLAEKGIGVVVILCGCPRACGNKEEVKARAKRHLLVAGESIDGKAVREEHLPRMLQEEFEHILAGRTPPLQQPPSPLTGEAR